MLDWCMGPRRSAQIQRAIKHAKVTILCLALTVVVLRGMIGADEFGIPEQDLKLLHTRLSQTRRVLEESKDSVSDSTNPNSYEMFDIGKIFVDEEEEVEKKYLNQAYSLGLKISDWDEQRSNWLKEIPQFSNFLQPDKPRILLATGSSPKPCENPVGDHYLLKSIKNKIDYCRTHGIEIFYNLALLDAEMAGFWAKLPLIRKLLLSHPEIEYLWWMDSEAFELPWYKDVNLVMRERRKVLHS